MGQFEKIVVLAVLFAITVIVVISLSTQEDGAASNPLAGLGGPAPVVREELAAGLRPAPRGQDTGAQLPLGTEESRPGAEFSFEGPSVATVEPPQPELAAPVAPQGPDPLGEQLEGALASNVSVEPRGGALSGRAGDNLKLSADVQDLDAPRKAPRSAPPAGSILVTGDDLAPTPHPDFMSYTLRYGDTYTGLAQRFYGSSARITLLQQANEGRRALREGEDILVPVFDFTAAAPERPIDVAAAPGVVPAVGATYEVQPGENLWAISKKHYGTGTRWQEVFEANRDVLRNADAVQAGMLLRIP